MSSTRRWRPAEQQPADWRHWSVRSALAAPAFSPLLAAGVAAEVAVGALDVVTGAALLVSALLVLPPLVVSLTGRWGDTSALALLALAIVLGTPAVSPDMEPSEIAVPLLLVLLGGAVAVAVSLVRAGTAVVLARFGLLMRLADTADGSHRPEELVDAALGLLVPGMGDVAIVDAVVDGEHRRLGVRGGPGVEPAALQAMRRRRWVPAREANAPEGAVGSDRSMLMTAFEEVYARASNEPGDERAMRSVRPRTAVTTPLRARGLVIGALTCVLGPSGRRHSQTDLLFAELFAGRLALALDNAGLTRELSAAEEEHDVIVDALAEAVTMNAPDGKMVYVNDAGVRLLRARSAEELLSQPVTELMERFAVYDEDGAPLALEDLPSARMLRGEPDPEPLLVRNVVRATGEERWLLHKVSALRGPDGELLRVVNVIEDLTTVTRAERGQRLLARASDALAATMDPRGALQELVEAIVPGFACWAAVDLPGRGRVDRAAAAGSEPAGGGHALEVPLQVGAQALGTLRLAAPDPSRPFDAEELALAEELGRRAGVALLNARMYERRTAIAGALQHGLLPPALPDVPGWPAAVSYLPAGELSEVGGDFYDIFRGPGGWMLIVGDMVGQGPEAATLASLARYTLRAAAELTGDPARAVAHLNAVLRGQPGVPLCTVVCACLDDGPDGVARLSLASAGHPPPMVVRGAEVTAVGEPGTIAGAFDAGEWVARDVELRRGDVLVLYTDGVLDAVGEHDRYGEARLRASLEELGGPVEERVAGLAARLETFCQGERRDDVTVLMLEYRGAPALSEPPPAAVPPRR